MTNTSETRYQRIGREQAERRKARLDKLMAAPYPLGKRERREFRRLAVAERRDADGWTAGGRRQIATQVRIAHDHDRDCDLPGDDIPERPEY